MQLDTVIYGLCAGLILNCANRRDFFMEQVPYINYKDLDEFYKIQQLADLFGITKQELKQTCEKYDIKLRRNETGDYGIVRFDVHKLHNALYHESRGGKKDGSRQREDNP